MPFWSSAFRINRVIVCHFSTKSSLSGNINSLLDVGSIQPILFAVAAVVGWGAAVAAVAVAFDMAVSCVMVVCGVGGSSME